MKSSELSHSLRRRQSIGPKARQYAVLGALFGVAFPIVATAVSLVSAGALWSLASIANMHRTEPLLWIIDTAPLFLGLFAALGGTRADILEARNRELVDQERDLATTKATLEERVDARTLNWQAVIEVARAASAIHDPDELTAQVVNLISDRFGYYYAAMFLLNESGDFAELHSATGEAGRRLKEDRHRLPVGGHSMVGAAIAGREPRVALDTSAETVRFDNPLLPYTRSEIALPLVVGDRVLGALDVQSTKPGAFGPAEVDTLQAMANQVAIAFENARLFQGSLRSLENLQAVQRQYVLKSWQPLTGSENLEYRMGDDDAATNSREMDVPMSLRDQIIGAISLGSESEWTEDQRTLVEAVASQAALALENARLVESTQATAQRERLLGEITSKVWSSPTLDGILRVAAGELGAAMGADLAEIEVRMDADDG